MYTVIETPVYSSKVGGVLAEDERDAFAAFIASNPLAGSVVRGSGGVRKVRWARKGGGKSGGARIIYYNRLANEEIRNGPRKLDSAVSEILHGIQAAKLRLAWSKYTSSGVRRSSAL